ncbi:SNF2 family N-terminal domain-containing protein [Lactarius hengduanensis]|nr:SNF2 family N-terminal domain-containing protein [Lactarius hengduanensis]
MPTTQNTPSHSLTAESSLSILSQSSDDVPRTRIDHKAVVYIEPPPLPPTERVTYEAVSNRDLPENFDYSLPLSDRVIVGEYRDNATRWYYVENADGIIYRFKTRSFLEAFPHSVSEYEYRKEAGLIPPFDPSASNVHPDSRPKILIRIPLNRSSKKSGLSKRHPSSAESRSDEEWEHDIAEGDNSHDDDNDDDDVRSVASSARVLRRNARRSTVKVSSGRTDLPFSPKKTRLRKRLVSESESSMTSVSDGVGPTRRSTRIRKSLGIRDTGPESESGESETGSDESFSPNRSFRLKGKPNIPKRGKASRAAYGHIRSIADLGYDELENGPLSGHRYTCERCQREPTHLLLQQRQKKASKSKAKRKPRDEFEEDSDGEDKLAALGGWVRCLKCPLAAHWRCLASTQRDEILKAVQARDHMALEAARGKDTADAGYTAPNDSTSKDHDLPIQLPPKRPGLESHQTTEFICSMCMKGGICMGCKNVALEPELLDTRKVDERLSLPGPAVLEGTSGQNTATGSQPAVPSKELLFRCRLCKRLAHYAHLPPPHGAMNDNAEVDTEAIAEYYQRDQDWSCSDCISFVYRAEKILAWRPYPPNATQPELPPGESIGPKMNLPREYLVKWQDRSYRRVQWVPHGWLASVHAALLRNFLTHGPRVNLLDHAVREDQVANAVSEGGIGGTSKESDDSPPVTRSEDAMLLAISDAERRIPPAWKTIDRVLDVLIWSPGKRRSKTSKKKAKMTSVDADLPPDPDAEKEWNEVFESGEEPSTRNTRTLDEWEAEKEDDLSVEDIDRVVWAFIKWDDLGYDEASWDSPPRPGEPGHSAFKVAFGCFLESRKVHIKLRNKKQIEAFENRPKNEYRQRHALKEGGQLNLGQQSHLKLMPFQVDGFNWLCDNWWNHQPSILADEMGLGKTVQIVTYIGSIIKSFDACPILVVVPNSTITNWAREFASWAPGVRVVPFYGEAKSRDVIKRYELTHSTKIQGTTGAKFHVLVTTYDTITSKDFNPVIKSVPRWEVLVVDEGQRLKNDQGLLFKKLNELKVSHRIIMTGTPLNNNIRELFNLMNFLDPNEWGDLERLEKEHEELTEDLVKELHNRLRPYFLRRLKGQVLQLPPKNEVIVPVSLTPLQKEIYKSVLGKNVEILKSLTLTSDDPRNSTKKLRTGSMNNILMDLRKCIQHPYLVSHDIEPKGLSPQEAHSRLVAGSAKLRFLQGLLFKLKARGHRVLLFSQFVIALDLIEDFIDGEGFKHLRLDGNTKQSERQKGMDEFNRPGSDVFIYLLSTRAGGVGINLWSADTVIIFDPDFNPHQAIARAHRYGQTKPCLVFKLMAKDTAEERIMQTGKKKLVLDHVIVQKMDDEEGGSDVRSILTYGAQALFDETADARNITYSDQDLDKLIEKTETEGEQPKEAGEDTGHAFSFAKVWTAENDGLVEVDDQAHKPPETDSWAHTLELIAKEKAQMKATERTGRGVRRKAAIAAGNQQMFDFLDSPDKRKPRGTKRKKSRSTASESDGYVNANLSQSENSSDEPFQEDITQDIAELHNPPVVGAPKKSTGSSGNGRPPPVSASVSQSIPNPARPDGHGAAARRQEIAICSMCGNAHQGTCGMTEHSENLVHYRRILFNETGEPFEERRDAIGIIDHTLEKRGQLHLVYNQPLRLVEKVKREASVPSRNNPDIRVKQRAPTQLPSSHPKNSSLQKGVPNAISSSSAKSARGGGAPGAMPQGSTSQKRPSDSHAQGSGKSAKGGTPGAMPQGSTSQKRPSDAQAQGSAKKRHRTNNDLDCPVCGGPHHLVKDCPVTAAGPESIQSAISRLKSQPDQTATVAALLGVLQKYRKRAVGQMPGSSTGTRK